jgi:hypothetical protein
MKCENLTIGQRVYGVEHGHVTTGTIVNWAWIGDGPNAVQWDHVQYEPDQFSINIDDAVATRAEAEKIAHEHYNQVRERAERRRIRAETEQRMATQRRERWEALYGAAWALAAGNPDDCDFLEHYVQDAGPTKSGFQLLRDFIKSRNREEQ